MMGIGSLVTRANVGAFQRLYALVNFSWIGVASYALLKYFESREANVLARESAA